METISRPEKNMKETAMDWIGLEGLGVDLEELDWVKTRSQTATVT